MYIPPLPTIETFTGDSNSNNPSSEKWSSFIGIVTAITGNVLISFALNTQRYAHLRLSRDQDEQDQRRRAERKKRRKQISGYGTQEDIAEERAKVHRQPEEGHTQDLAGSREEVDETAPLIPSMDSLHKRKTSNTSSEGDDSGSSENDEEDEEAKSKSYLRSPIWWLGIAMMTVGEAGNFLAYGFAPASIVSPMGVVALVSNCLIAPLLLHERFRWRDGVGVIVAVAGCVTVVLSASDSNPKLDPDSIWHLITRWEFETYLGVTVFLIIVLCVASNRFGDRTILIDLGLVGLFGGYTALSTKGVASLLSNTIWRVVTFPITYLLVAVLVGTAVMQIKYVNRALQRFNATMVIPTQFVMFTLSVIIGSAILYRDFERTTTEQAIKFVGGCALTFLGVYFITSGRNDDTGDEEDEDDLREEGIGLVDEERTRYEVRERDTYDGRRPSILATSSKSVPVANPPNNVDASTPIIPPPLPPAEAAAIHTSTAGPLHPTAKPPPMHATTSAPEIPTTRSSQHPPPALTTSRPKTPSRHTSTPAIESPSKAPPSTPTPRRLPLDQQQTSLDPNTSHKLLNRHSLTDNLLPGPLTSPLSSSLSAIVADSLRRGVDPLVRRRSLLRQRTGGVGGGTGRRDPNALPLKRHSIASGEMDFPDIRVQRPGEEDGEGVGLGEGEATTQGRVRSLSAAVGDIFSSSPSSPSAGRASERRLK